MVEDEPDTEDMTKVLEAISLCQSTLTLQIEEVKVDISLIRQDLHKLRERVSETGHCVGHMEDKMPPLQVTTEQLQHQLNSVLHKQDDMENRLRRCNLHLVGLPGRAEGSDPPTFLQNLLIITFGRDASSSTFVVERVHCLAARPSNDAPLRTFNDKFFNYCDRDAILRLTRVKGNIPFNNVHVSMFPNFFCRGPEEEGAIQ